MKLNLPLLRPGKFSPWKSPRSDARQHAIRLYNNGLEAEGQNDEEAARFFYLSTKLDPTFPPPLIAQSAQDKGFRVRRLEEEIVKLLCSLSINVYLPQEKDAAAENRIREAIVLLPNEIAGHYALASFFERTEQFKQARDKYLEVLRMPTPFADFALRAQVGIKRVDKELGKYS